MNVDITCDYQESGGKSAIDRGHAMHRHPLIASGTARSARRSAIATRWRVCAPSQGSCRLTRAGKPA